MTILNISDFFPRRDFLFFSNADPCVLLLTAVVGQRSAIGGANSEPPKLIQPVRQKYTHTGDCHDFAFNTRRGVQILRVPVFWVNKSYPRERRQLVSRVEKRPLRTCVSFCNNQVAVRHFFSRAFFLPPQKKTTLPCELAVPITLRYGTADDIRPNTTYTWVNYKLGVGGDADGKCTYSPLPLSQPAFLPLPHFAFSYVFLDQPSSKSDVRVPPINQP